MIEDSSLVENAKAGDSQAFGELVRRYQEDVRSFLRYRIRDNATADDLAQEVFLGAMKSIDGLRKSNSVRSWLLSIARFKMIDFLRSETRRKNATNELELLLENTSRKEETKDSTSFGDVAEPLNDCILKLQPKAKQILQMYYFDNVPATEIAVAAKQKPNAVRMTLLRIRRALAKCIRQRMGESFTHE